MSRRKRSLPQPEGAETEPKRTAPELDFSKLFVETISPLFEPVGILLRRVFLINN
jgi:hypothetical protein